MALTDLKVKHLNCPEGQSQMKKSDGNGLYILVKSNGSKLWRMKFTYNGKEGVLAFGQYPTIPLSEARKMTVEARTLIAQGINPAEERRAKKRVAKEGDRIFEVVALKWWQQQESSWSEDHAKKVRGWITSAMKPIAKLPVDTIDAGHVVELMLSIEADGKRRAASPMLSVIKRIFFYAAAHRYTRHNPAEGLILTDILKPLPKVVHRAAITNQLDLGQLIRDIDTTNSGTFCTAEALKLIPRLFLRPQEIRCLKWEYIDFDRKLLEIPAEEMKRGREHLVPLAKQVVEQLEVIQKVTGYSLYVFPSQRNSDNPISKNVMTNRLRDLGYGSEVMSAHGFRSSASTILHEQGWPENVIETQLAHLTGTATSRAYNRSLHLDERRKMMQSWANQLDALRDGADVVSIGMRGHS